MRFGIVVSALVATLATASAETVTERARRLFDEGRALADRNEPGACPRFEESYRLVAAAGTGFNLAECMERGGNFVRARELFEAIAVEYERDGKAKRAAIARERAVALRDKLGEIVLELDPAIDQLVLVVGGQRVTPAAAIRQLANPGDLEISATAPGRRAFVSRIRVRAGQRETVRIVLPLVDTVPAETRRRRGRVYLAVGLGAASVAAFVTGGIVFAGARELDDQGQHDRAVTRADLATAIGAGGLALAAAGVIVFVTAPRERVGVVPTATGDTAGIAISGRF
jgi:hypothetical protein